MNRDASNLSDHNAEGSPTIRPKKHFLKHRSKSSADPSSSDSTYDGREAATINLINRLRGIILQPTNPDLSNVNESKFLTKKRRKKKERVKPGGGEEEATREKEGGTILKLMSALQKARNDMADERLRSSRRSSTSIGRCLINATTAPSTPGPGSSVCGSAPSTHSDEDTLTETRTESSHQGNSCVGATPDSNNNKTEYWSPPVKEERQDNNVVGSLKEAICRVDILSGETSDEKEALANRLAEVEDKLSNANKQHAKEKEALMASLGKATEHLATANKTQETLLRELEEYRSRLGKGGIEELSSLRQDSETAWKRLTNIVSVLDSYHTGVANEDVELFERLETHLNRLLCSPQSPGYQQYAGGGVPSPRAQPQMYPAGAAVNVLTPSTSTPRDSYVAQQYYLNNCN